MKNSSFLIRFSSAVAGMALLGGCASLPSSGPTAREIVKMTKPDNNPLGIKLIDIDPSVVATTIEQDKRAAAAVLPFSRLTGRSINDTVGVGDILQISVFEVGVALFGQTSAGGESNGGSFDPSARAQTLPSILVDRSGAITLPYAGRIEVVGRTSQEIQTLIEQRLHALSQKPQAVVTVRDNGHNSVILFGQVHKPGRYPLTLQQERLLDAIALGGGVDGSSEDTLVRVTRSGVALDERLGQIRSGSKDDIFLMPGDRIELIRRPRTFLVLGASSHVSQVPFETGDVSLAEAVARAGGPTDQTADPSAIFIFRYVPSESGGREIPTVYRLNLIRPMSYFISQRFMMRDKDVIYIANAAANQPSKLISILNQLFSPLITARVLTQ